MVLGRRAHGLPPATRGEVVRRHLQRGIGHNGHSVNQYSFLVRLSLLSVYRRCGASGPVGEKELCIVYR